MASISQFIKELRRRNVFRTGAAYVVVAWLLVQASDILLETFAAPTWAMRAIVIALAVGFPVVLILAWVYEITTEGVKRTEEVFEGESISVHTGRQIDFVIIGVLMVAVALFASERFRWIDFGTVPSTDLRSIAVLPFDNLSGDPEQEYFSDGMTDTLITELSKFSALRVISRQSVMQFKGSNESLPEIARKLNVDAVIEGSALLIGEQVRITVQLIEAATDVHLWADNYDRDLRDVLAIHSDVARAIAREIHIVVTPEEAALLATREVNPEAYRLYLLAQHHFHRLAPAELDIAIEYYQQAIALDPQYAQAHQGLAGLYTFSAFYAYIPPREAYERIKAMTAQALELDSNLADAHQTYAMTSCYFDWEWEKAEEEFQRVIELNPNHAAAHQLYAWCPLIAMGRTEEALTNIRRSLKLDPLYFFAYWTASDVFYMSRQYDQAITQLQEALILFPNDPFLHSRLGWSYLQKGMFTEAIGEMKRAAILLPNNVELSWMLGHAYAATGNTAEARNILDDLHSLAKERYVLPYGFALIHTGLGEYEEALEWLERAYQDRNSWMPFLAVEPRLDPLRSDPRFQDLLRRMNL